MQRKVKERKGKSIVDTNVSMSDAEHPTRERVGYKCLLFFLNEEMQFDKDCLSSPSIFPFRVLGAAAARALRWR